MPPINEHIKLSLKRTGKSYRELHEWIDDRGISEEERIARHNIINISNFLQSVEKKFGKEGVGEYLQHIKDDYEKSLAYKLAKILLKLKFW